MLVIGVLGVIAMIAANAFFVAIEFALVAVDRHAVEVDASRGSVAARRVLDALRRLSATLSSAQLGITLSSLLLGLFAEPVIARLLEPVLGPIIGDDRSTGVSLALAFVVATAAQMVLGELIPKGIAIASPRSTAERLAGATAGMNVVFRPLTVVLDAAANAVVRALGIEPREELTTARSRQELSRLVQGSFDHGDLDGDEELLLRRGLRFGPKSAGEVMTPRNMLTTIDVADSAYLVLGVARETGFSRFPVVDGSSDDIVGVLDIRSFLGWPVDERGSLLAGELAGLALVVPERRELAALLTDLRSRGEHMAIVADEYGGTAGVVTIEDILEQIVGDIHDESDDDSAVPVVRASGSAELSGRSTPDEVEEVTGLVLPDGPYATVAGFILNELGDIPEVGARVVYGGWVLTVSTMERYRIDTVTLVEQSEVSPS